ncbi:MAG: ABC transporter permease [Erysipelotrichaceae bacterium]|nr:ABC transporter permease [Erysipelotrichaceae bacterium]
MSVKVKKKFDIADYTGLLSSLIAIVGGLLIAFIVLMLTNPNKGFAAFTTLITGGFKLGGFKNLGTLFYFATPILCTGVAMCLAFQAGIFNIGGPGQYSVGALAAILTSLYLSKNFPGPLAWIVPLIVATIAGAAWAFIPGILKAYFNVNVVIGTIMFNYIEMYYMMHWINEYCYDALKGQTKAIPAQCKLPQWFMPSITGGNKTADIGILIAILFAILSWILIEKTQLGYELKACGKNAEASRYAGIKSKRNIMISILLSGALCGLGGGLTHLSVSGTYITMKEALAAEGFNGIAVCCLANNSPLGAILGALFLAFLTVGGNYMQIYGFQREIVSVITSVIIYFAAFSLFLKQIIEKKLNAQKKEINKVTGEELK